VVESACEFFLYVTKESSYIYPELLFLVEWIKIRGAFLVMQYSTKTHSRLRDSHFDITSGSRMNVVGPKIVIFDKSGFLTIKYL
jgi:hypothetical protein